MSAARVASIFSLNRRLPAWKGEPLMLTIISAPAARWTTVGPTGYQMSSQMLTPTDAPLIRYTGQVSPGAEVAVFVEDAVVGQEHLVIDVYQLAIVGEGGGVVRLAA